MQENNLNLEHDILEPTKKNLRLRHIAKKVREEKIITVKNLADFFNVTKMTIYRDVNFLQKKKLVIVSNGVVFLNETSPVPREQDRKDITYDLPTEMNRHPEEKKKIVLKAAELIESGDIIYLDSGSTMEYLSRVIPDNKNIVVGCHAFYVLVNIQMKKGCEIIFSGGYFHEETQVFTSDESVDLLRRIRINKAFFTAGGVSSRLGVTCSNSFVLNIKQAVLDSSHEKILLVDSSKFNTVKKFYYADLNEFDIIITDSNISPTYKEIIEDMGITLYIVT